MSIIVQGNDGDEHFSVTQVGDVFTVTQEANFSFKDTDDPNNYYTVIYQENFNQQEVALRAYYLRFAQWLTSLANEI